MSEVMEYKFFKIWNISYEQCLNEAMVYIGLKQFGLHDNKFTHGIGSTFCVKHAPLVLSVMQKIRHKSKKFSDIDIELIALL